MPGHVFLEGDRIVLRPVEQDEHDHAVLGYVRNEPSFRHALGFDTPWPRKRVEEFAASTATDESSINLFVCLPTGEDDPGAQWDRVESGDSPPVVGAVNLFDIDRVSGTLSYWLFEQQRGNGYATEAVSLVLDYAFEELGLHRVEADVFSENDPSQDLLERLGFVHEGTARECRLAGGEYGDVHQYAVLETEWTGPEDAR